MLPRPHSITSSDISTRGTIPIALEMDGHAIQVLRKRRADRGSGFLVVSGVKKCLTKAEFTAALNAFGGEGA